MTSHFDYNPKDASDVLPEGEYESSIYRVSEADKEGNPLVSKKSGEQMQKVTFEVYAGERRVKLDQYFTVRSMLWLYKRMAQALGQEDAFRDKKFNAMDHLGAQIRLALKVEDNAQYGEQNRIDKFLPSTMKAAPKPVRTAPTTTTTKTLGGADDGDIPF